MVLWAEALVGAPAARSKARVDRKVILGTASPFAFTDSVSYRRPLCNHPVGCQSQPNALTAISATLHLLSADES